MSWGYYKNLLAKQQFFELVALVFRINPANASNYFFYFNTINNEVFN